MSQDSEQNPLRSVRVLIVALVVVIIVLGLFLGASLRRV